MQLLPLDDPRWKGYRSGYTQQPLDVSVHAAELARGEASQAIWSLLWDQLHHQGVSGEAAYAIVPYLAAYATRARASLPWQVFGFPVVVELARFEPDNPALPPELEDSYQQAFGTLAIVAAQHRGPAWGLDVFQCAAACLALSHGQRLLARAYLEFNKGNAARFLKQEIGYDPDAHD